MAVRGLLNTATIEHRWQMPTGKIGHRMSTAMDVRVRTLPSISRIARRALLSGDSRRPSGGG